MSNKGYQLADGTWSTEYKVGDLFEAASKLQAAAEERGQRVILVTEDGELV